MSLHGQLRSWQVRETVFRTAWAVARLVAVVVVVLSLACLTDWLIDRSRDTWMALRVAMTLAQVVLYAAAAFLLFRFLRIPSLDQLAGKAEESVGAFDHRLVTSLQLNRAGARTHGMSPALIAQVTKEAEELAAKHRLASLAESRRLAWAAALLAPAALFVGGFAVFAPDLTRALLARQALLNVDIPRNVHLTDATPPIWPSGEEVTIRYKVAGPVADDAVGYVRVYPENQPPETFELKFAERTPDGNAVFTARIPPSSENFTFRARVGAGRTRERGRVEFVSRPAVKDLIATATLPRYANPAGDTEYHQRQPQGEVIALPDSSVDVVVDTTKPVKSAVLTVLAREENGQEVPLASWPMRLSEDRTQAAVRFGLPRYSPVVSQLWFRRDKAAALTRYEASPYNALTALLWFHADVLRASEEFGFSHRPVAYRVDLTDENGFTNLNPPRRGINLAPDDPPRVDLLVESFKGPKDEGPIDDYRSEWMQPRLLNGRIAIGYRASSPVGIDRVYLVYRVNQGPWTSLSMTRTLADEAKVGKFVPEIGLFTESAPDGQVEFYQLPSEDPDRFPPGTEAGGRFNFQIGGLKKQKMVDGMVVESGLEIGDSVEIRVAAFDRNPAPAQPPSQPPENDSGSSDPDAPPKPKDTRRPAGWSPALIKKVVSDGEFFELLRRYQEMQVRLADLEKKQREVFKPKGKDEEKKP